MPRSIRILLIPLSLFVLCASPPTLANLDSQQIQLIHAEFDGGQFTDFADFLTAAVDSTRIDSAVKSVAESYLMQRELNIEQANSLYRLLGIYTRIKYGEQAIETLKQLVAIPTFEVEGVPQHENPNFHRLATTLESIADDFGLMFRNVDQRVYEFTLPGKGNELIGFHAHGDVVPVNPALWVLKDGTRLDPFQVTQIGNRLYGRGTQDDKNGIVVSLYAMRVIQEEGLPLLRTLRLLVDTTEETASTAIPYYFERNPVPNYNIALDGSYPVIIAEKGYGSVMASFPVRRGSGEGAEVLSITGGLATNQIPAASIARLRTTAPTRLATTLNEVGSLYRAAHGDNFQITAVADGDTVTLSVLGLSAHSSEPQNGINPVSRMLGFLNYLNEEGLLQSNHITDAATYATQNWGLNYLGEVLDIAYADDFMGPLTTALTFVNLDEQRLRLAVNLRLPVGRVPDELMADISTKLDQWAAITGIGVSFTYNAGAPMSRNPEGAWVNALLDIATENLDMTRQFGSSAGGTSIHNLPNGVQFGLAMPDLKYTGHNANEFKTVDQFLLDLQIVSETFARLGRMPSL